MFLAFRTANARDWHSNLVIAFGTPGRSAPTPVPPRLSEGDSEKQLYGARGRRHANLAFIGGKTNRKINDKAPNQYFPTLIKKSGPGAFEAQCIPTQDHLLDVGAYKSFLEERRRLVAERLK